MKPVIRRSLTILALLPVSALAIEVDSRILDAAARIDYGWMTEDPSLIVAAGESLPVAGNDAWGQYLQAYAAFRLAQLRSGSGEARDTHLDACLNAAQQAAGFADVEVEAQVLIAACSAMAAASQPLRYVLHQRRLRQSLLRAHEIEPGNPRLLLIAQQFDPMGLVIEPATPGTLLGAFAAAASLDGFPNWGEAEALTMSAEAAFALGDIRTARDLIEEVLLIAPDYGRAAELQRRVAELTTAD